MSVDVLELFLDDSPKPVATVPIESVMENDFEMLLEEFTEAKDTATKKQALQALLQMTKR